MVGLLTEFFLFLFLFFKKNCTTRKTSSVPDSRSPGLYTAWTLSTSSVSSQGSISESDPRQSRPFKSVFVPTAIVNPVRSPASLGTLGQGSLRKGRGSMRKSKWWQRGTCLDLRDGGDLTLGKQSGLGVLFCFAKTRTFALRLLYISQISSCFIRLSKRVTALSHYIHTHSGMIPALSTNM